MNKNRETLMKFISAQNQKVQDDISKQGYKDNSPYRDNPFNIIQGTPQGTSITMDGVSKRLYATDGQTSKILEPNSGTHFFSGPQVKETPMAKYGGLLNKTIKCSNCGWSWKAADGGSDVMDCHKCGGKGLIKAQKGLQTTIKKNEEEQGLEYFNQVKDWYDKYTNSPGYKENLIKSGYEDPQAIIDRRLANISNTKFKHDENRLGSYYNNKSNKILYSPIKDQMNFPGDGPDAILAHEVGHSSIDIGDGFFQGFKPNYNKYDYEQLKDRNKNPKISRGPHENYADQKALQYEAEKQGLYKAGYDEFTKEILDKLEYSDLKERALRNYSEEDLIWLLNNVAQNDNNKYELPVAEWGGAGMMYADRNYQEGGLTKYQIKGEVTEMKDWFLQNLPSPLLKQFPDLTKKDNSDVYDNYTSSLQSKLSSLIGTTFVPNLKGTQDEGQESLNCIGGACNASIKSGVNIPLITGNDFWDQAERKKIPFMVYANPKNKGDYAEALDYAKPGDFIGYSLYDGKTDYLPAHTNIFVNRFEKDGEEYIRTLDAYGEEGYHYKDYKVSELIEGGPYGKLFLGRPTRINGKNLNVNDLGLTKYFNDFSYAKEVPENVLNNLKPLSFTLNKDFVKKNNLTPEQVQQAATIINIASNKKRDIIKNTGMSEKTYDILARGLPGIVYNETRLGDTGIGRNIYEFAKTAATKLSKEGASEGPFQIRHKMMFKNPQTRKVLETLGITSDNYDSSNLGQQTVMAMVLFDNIEKTSLKDFDKPLKEKYYTISPEDAKKHGYDFKNMTDEQKEKIRQEHVKVKKNKESLSLFEKLIYLYNAPSIVKKREAQGDLQYAKVANNFLNMYLPKKQVGGPSYTVTGDQPIIIPSQGSYPLEYRDRGDKDVDGVPFSAARMVSRVDAQGKPLTRNQIAENQLMWNMQKQAYSPQQQLFNNWKNNPENTEQGFYNMSDWEKYLKSITPKGKDVPLEGLEIGKANKRGEVKGSCTTGDSMGGDSLRDNKYGGLTKYQNAGTITSEERKPYNGYPPVNNIWLGNKLTKEGYITSTTKGGNYTSFTGNDRADDWINKQIDSGKFGFDPKTMSTFPLKKPVKGLSKEDQFIGSETFSNLQTRDGFTNESQKAQIKKLPEWQQNVVNNANEKLRKGWIKNSMNEVYKHPLWYGPGMVAAGIPAVAALEVAGAAAYPYITAALATQIPGMAAVPGATFGNAITTGFAAHGLTHIGPDTVEMYKNPSWSNAGSLGMDVLEIAPIVGPAAKMMGEGLSATRKALTTEQSALAKLDDIRNIGPKLETEIAALKQQEVLAEESRKALYADYKAGKITAEEYTAGAKQLDPNKLLESRNVLEKQLRDYNVKQDIANAPQQNILKSENQLGKDISDGGSNTKGVFELGDDYVARLSAHGYDDSSRLVNYANKIKSPRTAKTLQVKEIDGKVYQVQNKATGTPITQLSEQEFKNMPKEHIDNFWKDKAELDDLGLSIDISGGKSNVYYDPKKGFQIIDLGIGKSPTNQVISDTYKGLSLPTSPVQNITVVPTFKSEIDWSKWNKEIPENTQLMDEYNAIEQTTKTNGSWMKNPDGSTFQGTPEQFVQQQSQNFKNAFGNPVLDDAGNVQYNYHGSPNVIDNFDKSKFFSGKFGKGVYTSADKEAILKSYANPDKSRVKKIGEITGTNSQDAHLYELYLNSNNKKVIDDIIDVPYNIKDYGKALEDYPSRQELYNKYSSQVKENSWIKTDEDFDKFLSYIGETPREKANLVMPEVDFLRINDTPLKEQVTPFSNYPKSAIGNNGMFDMTNPNIYKSVLPYAGYTGAGTLTYKALQGQEETPKYKQGGELPKAQFGIPMAGAIANKIASWFSDDEKKPVVRPIPVERTFHIKDPRTIRATTQQPIRPTADLLSGTYNSVPLDKTLREAKRKGLSKDDMWNLAGMALAETGLGNKSYNIGQVVAAPFEEGTPGPYEFVDAYISKMKEADRLGIKDPVMRLQVYNGLGPITPDTEKSSRGYKMQKAYGVPLPKEGISMKKRPLYGINVLDAQNNVLKKNPEFVRYIDSIYKAPVYKQGGVTKTKQNKALSWLSS